ncbi:hypothetical protein PAT3040_02803, partial [Paenibacillus agaridevorans]
ALGFFIGMITQLEKEVNQEKLLKNIAKNIKDDKKEIRKTN